MDQPIKGQGIEVGAGDIIIFYDKRFPPDPGSGTSDVPATNRVAVVVDERGALFLGQGLLCRKVETLPLGLIATEKNAQVKGLYMTTTAEQSYLTLSDTLINPHILKPVCDRSFLEICSR